MMSTKVQEEITNLSYLDLDFVILVDKKIIKFEVNFRDLRLGL